MSVVTNEMVEVAIAKLADFTTELPDEGMMRAVLEAALSATPAVAVEKDHRSEFGSGLVVCLAKFSEHLNHKWGQAIYELEQLRTEERQEELSPMARHQLDFALRWWNDCPQYRRAESPLEAAISEQIHMWANGASDHFYDLDRERAPQCLVDLADLTLRMGHGFIRDDVWTVKDFERALELWQQSCIELDRLLGTTPDWGRF